MRSHYYYDCNPPPLSPLTSPGLTAAHRAFDTNQFQRVSFLWFLFKAVTLSNVHQPYSLISRHGEAGRRGVISTTHGLLNKMPVIFHRIPNFSDSRFSVFSPGLLHSYK